MAEEKSLTQELIDLAEDCQKKTGVSPSRIAVLAGTNGNFFKGLEEGKSCTIKTYEAIKAKIAEIVKARGHE